MKIGSSGEWVSLKFGDSGMLWQDGRDSEVPRMANEPPPKSLDEPHEKRWNQIRRFSRFGKRIQLDI
jgi:hypothetical protein